MNIRSSAFVAVLTWEAGFFGLERLVGEADHGKVIITNSQIVGCALVALPAAIIVFALLVLAGRET